MQPWRCGAERGTSALVSFSWSAQRSCACAPGAGSHVRADPPDVDAAYGVRRWRAHQREHAGGRRHLLLPQRESTMLTGSPPLYEYFIRPQSSGPVENIGCSVQSRSSSSVSCTAPYELVVAHSLAQPHSGSPTFPHKMACWVRSTNPSTLQWERSRAHHIGETN